MERTFLGEVERTNRNLFWTNAVLLAASVALALVPLFLGLGYRDGNLSWLVAPAPFVLLALWNVLKAYQRFQRIESHPFLVALQARGPSVLEAVTQDLDRSQEFKRLFLGRAWLLRRGVYGLDLAALEDVMWAYKRDHYGGHMIYSQVVVRTRLGRDLLGDLSAKAEPQNLFLGRLTTAAPWVLVGENDALSALWRKNRADFCAQVDQRRKVLESRK